MGGMGGMGVGGAMYVVLLALCVALIIAWIVLPFAIIGTKPLLRELISEVKVMNELLARSIANDVPRLRDAVDTTKGRPTESRGSP